MRICSLAIKVLHIFVACLIVGSSLGWFPASVNASSRTQAPDFSIYSSLTQNTAIESSPIASNPLYSPANGIWEVTDTIHLSGTERPLQIAVTGGKAYISRNPGHLTVLDLSTNAVVTTISFDPYPGAAPHYIGILGDKAYVALGNLGSDGQLAVINIGNNTVAGYIPVGADPYGVATLDQKVYVTNNVWWSSGDPATVKVVNASTNSVIATIPVGINPTGIAVDPVSKKAYVTNRNDLSKSVSVINTNANSVIATIPINNPPAGVAISGNRAYVTTVVNMPNGTVEVIDIGSDTLISSIPIGRDSWGIAASNDYVFVANQSSSTVSVIEVATNSVVATVNVGDDPTHIAVDPSTNKVYVSNQGDNTISVIQFKETAPPSNRPPAVSITSPPNGATVSGAVSVQGTASDPDENSQLQRVEVKVDTGGWTQASGTTSWSYSWDTTTIPKGQHSIYARSYDGQAYSNEVSVTVTVNNQVAEPSIMDIGITVGTKWPPATFLQVNPGDRFLAWYDIAYSGPRITVKLRTTIIDPNGRELLDSLGDPGLVLMEDMPGHTGWVGDDFQIPDTAITGTYDVRFSVWSEDGAREYDAAVKLGWLSLGEGNPPTAYIDYISPNRATQGMDTICFTGYGTDPDGSVVSYNWRSSIDGQLITSSSFNKPAFELSVGTHTIYFKVQDDDGLWSPEVTQDLMILSQECVVTIISGPEANPAIVDSNGTMQLSAVATDSAGHGISYSWTATGGSYDNTGSQNPAWYAPKNTNNSIKYYTLIVTARCGEGKAASGNVQVGVRPEEALPSADVYWLAKAIMSEASIGTQEEQVAVGWTMLNRLEGGKFGDNIEDIVRGGYVYNQEPTQEIVVLAKDLLERRIGDPTAGATYFFSPISMPKEGEEYKCKPPLGSGVMNCNGGLHEVPGIIKRVYFPSWAKTLEWIGDLHNVRRTHFMFYREPSPTHPTPPQYLGEQSTTLSEYYSAWDKKLPLLNERAKMYEALGLGSATSYAGTAEQNTRLLNALKQRQICPSTADELGEVVPPTTIAQLIEQEGTESVPVTVDGRQYYIVALKNRIDPITLEVVPDSGPTKVYVDAQNYPISDEAVAQQIGLIDLARRWMETAGSVSGIFQDLDNMERARKAHESLTGWKFASNMLTKAIAACITTGQSLTIQVVTDVLDTIVSLTTDPMRIIELLAYESFNIATEEYQEALNIIESGSITDWDDAKTYFNHLFTGHAYNYPAIELLLQTEELGKSWLDDLADMVNNLAQELIPGGNLLHPIENFVGYVEQLPCIVQYKEDRNRWLEYGEATLSPLKLHKAAPYTLELAQSSRIAIVVHSPVELRVYDSEQRVTGLVNGEERNEIPYSVYHDNSVTIFSPTDFYRYAVVGTSEGSYDLVVTTIAEQTSTFALASVPTSANAVHQYTIDWEALSKGKKGVTMKIDADGDGTFEETRELGSEGTGFSWVWIIVAGVSGLVGVLVGAFIVRRRASKERGA